ncbi:MAG TPA: P-loop NTPase fold protein [Chthoniobacterales bacterium]|jgi:hypothetical protein|nr:P-loop NTPase fold protein [Chthoniobacterales bacterium]
MRWFWIFAYAVLGLWFGLFVGLLFYRAWQLILRLWPESLAELQDPFLEGTLVCFLVVVLMVSGGRPRHGRYFWRYPPLLSALLLIATALTVTLLFSSTAAEWVGDAIRWSAYVGTALAWLSIGVVIPLCYRRHRRRKEQTSDDVAPKELQQLTFAELRTWLGDERPIESPSQDFFGAEDRARRIANALQTRRCAAAPHLMQTVVLEGPLGAGKSSVIRLLSNILEAEAKQRYLLITVSAWGFSSSAARQHILSQIVQVLSKDVDCLSVQDLPRDYVEAFTKANSWFALFKPALGELPPAVRLKRLLPILSAIDVHLVVVIEDSDRNDVDFNPQHLQSMLNDFREVERLSFILTVGSTSRVDFPKVAEQIESIPGLSRGDALSLVDQVRDYCRDKWPAIDPLENEPE